jgi:hypothetical protein
VDKIGTYAKLVDDRNDSAHPNGNIFFSTQAALDTKITEILRVADEIQTHSAPIIQRCYSLGATMRTGTSKSIKTG